MPPHHRHSPWKRRLLLQLPSQYPKTLHILIQGVRHSNLIQFPLPHNSYHLLQGWRRDAQAWSWVWNQELPHPSFQQIPKPNNFYGSINPWASGEYLPSAAMQTTALRPLLVAEELPNTLRRRASAWDKDSPTEEAMGSPFTFLSPEKEATADVAVLLDAPCASRLQLGWAREVVSRPNWLVWAMDAAILLSLSLNPCHTSCSCCSTHHHQQAQI